MEREEDKGNQKYQEKRIGTKLIYEGGFFKLYQDQVLLPNNRRSYREYIKHLGAVLVVPIFEDQSTILVKQYRYALGKILLEVPAGKVDLGEDLKEAAKRELQEETGYEAGKLEWLSCIYPCPGYSDETLNCYIATDLKYRGVELDQDEFVTPIRTSLVKAIEMIENGEIRDSKSITILYQSIEYVKKVGYLKKKDQK